MKLGNVNEEEVGSFQGLTCLKFTSELGQTKQWQTI